MEYITITADNYEEAVDKARSQYGDRVRIHSRRDFQVGGGFFAKKRKRCEIICYLSSEPKQKKEKEVSSEEIREFENEAKTPDPDSLSAKERLQTNLSHPSVEKEPTVTTNEKDEEAQRLLDANNIRGPFRDKLLSEGPFTDDVCLELSDRILSSVNIDHANQAHPKKFMVLLGPTGSGKTTTLAKIAALYKSVARKVAIVTLDSYRVGAYEQVKAFADAFAIPASQIKAEDEVLLMVEELSSYDLVLVDTMGISPKDGALALKLRGMLSLLPHKDTMFVLVSAANSKQEDITRHYKSYQPYGISSLIITKLDETESIGSELSFSYESGLPLLFCADGQKVPDDLKKASTTVILEYLKGFGYDVQRLAAQLVE